MSTDGEEREALVREISEMQHELETSSMRAFLEPLLNLDLTIQQLRVLMILVTEPEGSSGQAVAKLLGVSLATVSGIIDRLESVGMVERGIDPHDQRVRRLIATVSGRRAIQDLLAAQNTVGTGPLMQMEVDDLRALAKGLRGVLRVQLPGPTEA